jgi:hypothetical protein
MRDETWFHDDLIFLVEHFNRAKDKNETGVKRSLRFWIYELNSAVTRYSEAFHLENLNDAMPSNLLVRSAFRELGDVLEGCLQPFIRQTYDLFALSGDYSLREEAAKVNFGNLVVDLCTIPETREIYQGLLRGIPVHQWRNIAHHSSYSYNEQKNEITCVYGRKNVETVTFSPVELISVLQQVDRIVALHKIAVGLFTVDNADFLKDLGLSLEITKHTISGSLLSLFETHGFEIVELDVSGTHWSIVLKNSLGRSKEEFIELLNCAAGVTALRSDISLRFEVRSPDGRSLFRGELKKSN